MRRITNLLLALSLSTWSSAQIAFATTSDASIIKQIVPLEKQFLGHSFDTDAEEHRLDRLEKLLFGEVSTEDPATRIEKLHAAAKSASSFEDYTGGSENTKKTPGAPNDSETDKSASTSTGADDYPRIGALETAILGKVFASDPLEERLSRIETKAFGKASESDSLGDRTDALETYAEKKMHKPLVGQHNDGYSDESESSSQGTGQSAGQNPSRIPQIVNALSTAFLGASSLAPGGAAMGGLGFGGVRMRPRSEVQGQELDEDMDERDIIPDDPMVHQPSAPPPSAKMLVKVGWCEVQLFGRTFNGKHLTERLKQINGEIEFKPGKSGIALMDDVDALVKKIAEKRPAVGSKDQPPVR